MAEANEVFVKTENINDKLAATKARERLQTQREKRLIAEKYRNAKRLIDSDEDEEEDVAEWYNRLKRQEAERQESPAKKRQRVAENRKRESRENADREAAQSKRSRAKDSMYTSKDLAGIAIGHKVDSIKDGQNVILTLRDKDVLAEEAEDVLENVNIVDDERAAKNVENKTRKPDYKPYDDEEFDEFGILKKSSLLSKYDEEIEGPKSNMFRIGDSSQSQSELAKMRLQQQQQDGKITLSLPELRVTSEYYTAEEMVKFKKPKKIRKGTMRKKTNNIIVTPEMTKEEETIQTESMSNSADHGSRSSSSSRRHESSSSSSSSSSNHHTRKSKTATSARKSLNTKLDMTRINEQLELDLIGPDEDLSGIRIEEDEAEKELAAALQKTRKLKQREATTNLDPAAKIARLVSEYKPHKNDDDDDEDEDQKQNQDGETRLTMMMMNENDYDAESLLGRNIVLNTTAEFCRNLGDLPIRYGGRTSMKLEYDDEEDEDYEDADEQKNHKDEPMSLGDMNDGEDKGLSPSNRSNVIGGDDQLNENGGDDDDDDQKYRRNNWNEVDIKMEEEEEEEEEEDEDDLDEKSNRRRRGGGGGGRLDSPTEYENRPILEEEPDVSVGVAGALKLAMNKGYLDKDSKKQSGTASSSTISAQAYTIEEKFYDDDRMGRGGRDRYSGQTSEFREKDNYRPDFKLDYVDDKGRMMNQKEAFRYLSHKFHGKGPGMNKVDKRMKKFEQESKLRQMSSIDTPLNTLKLLQERQKEVQSPFVVLTGPKMMTKVAAAAAAAGASTSAATQYAKKKK